MRAAIVGLGTIGLRHLTTLGTIDGVEVAAVVDPRFEADGVLAVPTFASYEEALDTVPLDAVVLSTPSWLHAQQGIAAAERGIHVISEKPMATTLAEARDLVRACARNDVRLAVLHQYRFLAPVVSLKQAMDEGRLGRLAFLSLRFHWRRDSAYYEKGGGWRGTWRGDGGGALMNQGAHAVDLARWLGGPIASVMACTGNVHHAIEAEDTVCVALRFENGGLGTIQVTTCASRNHPALVEIQGTEGSAVISGRAIGFDGETPMEDETTVDPHRAQFSEIFRALAEGAIPPVDGTDALETLAATLSMYRSARHGVAVMRVATDETATPA